MIFIYVTMLGFSLFVHFVYVCLRDVLFDCRKMMRIHFHFHYDSRKIITHFLSSVEIRGHSELRCFPFVLCFLCCWYDNTDRFSWQNKLNMIQWNKRNQLRKNSQFRLEHEKKSQKKNKKWLTKMRSIH